MMYIPYPLSSSGRLTTSTLQKASYFQVFVPPALITDKALITSHMGSKVKERKFCLFTACYNILIRQPTCYLTTYHYTCLFLLNRTRVFILDKAQQHFPVIFLHKINQNVFVFLEYCYTINSFLFIDLNIWMHF